MSPPLIVAFNGNEALAERLVKDLDGELARTEFRRFPDGEVYVRFDTPMAGRAVIFACTLDRPDEKFLTLMFAAATARELDATHVGLVAPYLCYLRQDRRFKSGEAVTSVLFARMVSERFDWLVTIDPHLHRLDGLGAVYTIPATTLHAAPLIAEWITKNVPRSLLIGPDAESEQWVGAIAAGCQSPHIVLEKRRHGDRSVEISMPDMSRWRGRTPVLVDDIISSARTMIEAVRQLKMESPVCIGVHGVFGAGAYEALKLAGPRVVTTNTIVHETNEIDVFPLLVDAVRGLS